MGVHACLFASTFKLGGKSVRGTPLPCHGGGILVLDS